VPPPIMAMPLELRAWSRDSFFGTKTGTAVSYGVTGQKRTVELGHVCDEKAIQVSKQEAAMHAYSYEIKSAVTGISQRRTL